MNAEIKTDSPSATQRAYDRLREMIVTGRIAPGQRLKVESLKDLLDTGASPIREALSHLTSDQLVERLDQRGFRAAAVSETQFHEILTLRCALETMALRASIANGSQAWEDALVIAHHRLSRVPRGDVALFEAQHKAFHTALLTDCGMPILLRLCDQLYDMNIRYRYLAGKALSYGSRDVAQEHREIMEATLDRDADLAAARLVDHYTKTGEFLSNQLNQLPETAAAM